MRTIFITILFLFLFSCKENTTDTKDTNTSIANDSIVTNNSTSSSETKTNSNESFTIDCGSGCAMTYNEVSRKENKNSVEIKYNVIQYINENPQDEYSETYIFESDENELLKSFHLSTNSENILNDDSSLLKNELSKIGAKIFTKGIAKNNSSNTLEIVNEKGPYNLIAVPFDLKKYMNDLPNEIKNSYTPSTKLIDYLVSKGYEGENYKCFFLNTDEKSKKIITSITRGDSEYFVSITVSDNKFSTFSEIGSIGEETKYFKIDKNYTVAKY